MRCPSRVNSLSDPTRVIDGASYGVGTSEPESINVSMAAMMARQGSRRNTLKGSVRLVADPQPPDPLGLVLTNRPVLIDEWRRMSGRVGIKPIVQLTTFEPRRQPAIALVDLQGDIGIDMDRMLRTVPIVLLLDEPLTSSMVAALRLNIHAVLTWRDSLDELEQAVRDVLAGGHHISATAAPVVLMVCSRNATTEPPISVDFTARELAVMEAMVDGQTIASTARSLEIAAKTVEAHRSRAFIKLGVRTSSEAIAKMLTNPGSLG